MRRRGLTLLEMVLAVALLAILLATVFFIFETSAEAFLTSGAESDIRNQASVAKEAIKRAGRETDWDSLTVAPQALSLLTHRDEEGHVVRDDQGNPVWQAYLVFFQAGSELHLRRLPVAIPSTVEPIEEHDFGSGAQPLATYLSGGRVLARQLEQAEFLAPGPGQAVFRLVFSIPRSRNREDHRLEIRAGLATRN